MSNLSLELRNGNRNKPTPNRRGSRLSAAKLPLTLACVAGSACFLVASVLPKHYRSETTLYFISSPTAGKEGLLSALSGGGKGDTAIPSLGGLVTLPDVATTPDTAITILASERCRESVANMCNLPSRWHQPLGKVLGRLDDAATFSVNKYGLLDIEVDDHDPKLAYDIAQAYVKSLYQIATEMSVAPSKQTRVFIEGQLAEARKDLKSLEQREVAVQDTLGMGIPSDKLAAKAADATWQLIEARNTAQSQLAGTQAQITELSSATQTLQSNSLNLPETALVADAQTNRLRELEYQYKIAQETLGPDNPDYINLKIQVEQARKAVQGEVGREVGAVKSGVEPNMLALLQRRDDLQAQVNSLDGLIKKARGRFSDLPVQAMKEEHLKDDITIALAKVGLLETEAARARIAEDRDVPTFETVDPPKVPVDPSSPRRGFVTAFAALAGLLIGIALVMWQSYQSIATTPVERLEELPEKEPVPLEGS